MREFDRLVVFSLENFKYALEISSIQKVFQVVEVTPLPDGPEIVLGIVNVQGLIVPVLDIRRRFGFSSREIQLTDHLLIARTSQRTVALLVDAVIGTLDDAGEPLTVTPPDEVLPGIQHVKGVVKLKDGLLLIQDLDAFLSLEEEQVLDFALAPVRGQDP